MPALFIGALVLWGFALARIDFAEHRLPDRLTLPAYPAAVAIVAVCWPDRLGSAAATGLSSLVAALALHLTVDLGWGDVKLLGPWGILVGGADVALDALLVTGFVGGLHALIHWGVLRDRTAHLPFGPAILAGLIPVAIKMS